ncbi:MAG: lipopolysaccharide kinase InaA family protein [Chloroflexota bacterium]
MFICPQCFKSSLASAPLCQKIECPNEAGESILGEGDRVMGMEIVRVVTLLPRAAVYEVAYGRDHFLLKTVASAEVPRLERELSVWVNRKGFENPRPVPLPRELRHAHPYVGQMPERAGGGGFALFGNVEAESMPQYLARNQVMTAFQTEELLAPIEHEIRQMHHHQLVHLALNPASILVPWPHKKKQKPFLIDLGTCAPLAHAPQQNRFFADGRFSMTGFSRNRKFDFQADLSGLDALRELSLA